MKDIEINEDTGFSEYDEDGWRALRLSTNGSTLLELLQSALIEYTDSDGGARSIELLSTMIEPIVYTCERIITAHYFKARRQQLRERQTTPYTPE